jgi:acetyl-CoA carboxylase beta subunit
MDRFSTKAAARRVEAILDAGSFQPLTGSGNRTTTLTGGGRLNGEPVWIAATDPSRARGALGVAEAGALCMLFQVARGGPRPVVLLLDSAGAKVDEGLAGLGAFRRLFREALLTRIAGVPMLALLGRSCFGGASMLACLCHARLYSSETLLAVSGPAVIEALGGKTELDASDHEQVRALMGGEARTKLGGDELLCADRSEVFRGTAAEWLREKRTALLEPALTEQHERLRRRLQAAALDLDSAPPEPARQGMEHLIPAGYTPSSRGSVSLALPPVDSGKPAFLGALTGATVGAETCWLLADELLRLRQFHPASPAVLLLDASGHATTRQDEALMLSAYLAHLSLVSAVLAAAGHRITLWIPGAAAGAVYVAFAAPAERVCALPAARIRILPEAAVRQIVGASSEEPADPDALMRSGVIDAVLDPRLERYAQMASVRQS